MPDDPELRELYDADQAEHRVTKDADSEPEAAERQWQRSRERRKRVEQIDREGRLRSGADHGHAALIYLHGADGGQHFRRSHELARRGAELGFAPARWLAACALDHLCRCEGRPQRYGTVYVPTVTGMRLWDVDPATTDEERGQWDVPPLAEARRLEEEIHRSVTPEQAAVLTQLLARLDCRSPGDS